MFNVYILKSNKYKWYYVGLSGNVFKRLEEHNSGRVKSTKTRKPYDIIYTESFRSRIEARKREKQMKNGSYKKRFIENLTI